MSLKVALTAFSLVLLTNDCYSRSSESSLASLGSADLSRAFNPADWPGFIQTFYANTKPRKVRNKRRKKWRNLKSFMNRRRRKSFKSRPEPRPEAKAAKKPNVVLMLADDQDVELGSLQFMPKLNRFLKSGGAHMENGYVTTPMCCPSRSSLLTGLYAHNHHVLTNNENCSSTYWVENHEAKTFATYMHDAGYKTGYFGKYLNKYAGNHIPIGWDEWSGLVRNSRFYNYTLNVNGNKIKHGFDYAKDYFPDLITNDSLAFFRQAKQHRPNQPVMMVMSFPGPHGPEDSAPQYQDLFFNVTTHHTPAYDYAPNPDKQWILQVTDRMEPIQKKFTDVLMTKRLQTLQSIDEAIERLYHELDALGELENTYVFYTSDHGYHLGQFGLVKGKAFPFDVDTKVPFFVRGPGINPGTVRLEPVLNIDLAPTFLDIAGVNVPLHMDGKSILPTLLADNKMTEKDKLIRREWRDSFLIERGKMTVERYEKIRDSFPPEASNTTPWEAAERAQNEILLPGFPVNPFRENLLVEKPRVTKQERLAVECLKPRFQGPCEAFQRRKCTRKKNGDWKMVTCKDFIDFDVDFADDELNCDCETSNNRTISARSERKLQREFLKKHTRQQRKLRHKFLKLDSEFFDDYFDSKMRTRRSAAAAPTENVATVLKEIAEEEIDEVDIIMENINDEIHDLEQSIVNGSSTKKSQVENDGIKCEVSKMTRDVNCSSDVFTTPQSLRTSRAYVNEQIRRLRAQLFELKEIRKHLKQTKPYENEEKLPRQSKSGRCNCGRKAEKARRQRIRDARRSKREKLKLERLRRRLRRKERRQMKKSKRMRKERRKKKQEACITEDEKMNCFSHNNDHWKTKPLWTDGSFCACTNSNTNTYWCVRTINITHNYLYCEFVSGIITYYDLNVDPYQLRNIYQTLSDSELNYMHGQLLSLKEYSGFDGKWRPAEKRSRPSRQRQFIKRYGKILPPLDAYKKTIPNGTRRRRKQTWISMFISVVTNTNSLL